MPVTLAPTTMDRPTRGLLIPWLIAIGALVVYLATLSRHYTGDSIEYALAIESSDPTYLLDPYHPLLHPMGLAFSRLWQLLGWTGQALLPLQVLNALGGAACVGLVLALARALTQSTQIAVLVAAGFAVSGGHWMLSVEAEFVTVPLAAMLLVLWGLLAASPSQAKQDRYPVLLGLGTVLAIFCYLTAAFLVPVVITGLALDDRLSPAQRRRHLAIYGATVLAIAVQGPRPGGRPVAAS